MGNIFEINDSLQLTTEQGFPESIFNLERHLQNPITINQIKDLMFEFHGKPRPRLYHLDPVRVFWFHNIDGKWLAWGHIVIVEQTITKSPHPEHGGPINVSNPTAWITSGKYRVVKIYEPEYQKLFTKNDVPPGLSYF